MSTDRFTLGSVAKQIRGVSYDKSEARGNPAPGYIPILRANNITEYGLTFENLVYVPERRVSDHQILRTGDIVVAASSGSIEVVGKAAPFMFGPRCGFGAFCKVIRPSGEVEPSYIAHFFKTQGYRRKISSLAAGANINNLRSGHLDDLEIPKRPISEQKLIAATLDKAEELRAKRRTTIDLLNVFPPAFFRELFGDPLENDRGWPLVSISDFVAGFESGRSIIADEEDESSSRYRVLKVSAVTSQEFRPEESKPLPSDYVPPLSHKVRQGDLLFSRANTAELIGATAYVRSEPKNVLLPDKLWRFRWPQEPKTHPHFVRFLFQYPAFRGEITRRASGTSGSMKNISQDKVLSIKVGLPPIEVQRKFGRIVDHIEEEALRHQASQNLLDAIFSGLQHQAFAQGLPD